MAVGQAKERKNLHPKLDVRLVREQSQCLLEVLDSALVIFGVIRRRTNYKGKSNISRLLRPFKRLLILVAQVQCSVPMGQYVIVAVDIPAGRVQADVSQDVVGFPPFGVHRSYQCVSNFLFGPLQNIALPVQFEESEQRAPQGQLGSAPFHQVQFRAEDLKRRREMLGRAGKV
jgi:hypothetical protein